jgi:hypothetical protein
MKYILTAIVSAFMLVSAPSFASSPAGGKVDNKVDCSKKENEKDKACAKKDEKKK